MKKIIITMFILMFSIAYAQEWVYLGNSLRCTICCIDNVKILLCETTYVGVPNTVTITNLNKVCK